MTDSSANNPNPVLTFEGKRYDLNTLPDELKELVRGMQVADAQLRMHEDTLKVLAVGRQSLAMQLNEKLKSVTPMPENGRSFIVLTEKGGLGPPFFLFGCVGMDRVQLPKR